MALASRSFGELLAAGLGLLYGFGFLAIALGWSIRQKEFWTSQEQDEKAKLQQASRILWSLSNDVCGPAKHNFLKLSNGTQLHYLTPAEALPNINKLVIFLHGFPDSAYLFTRQLQSSLCQHAKLVAMDLPGCGGSDSLASYGPDQMLNTIADAIVLLKNRYLSQDKSKRCVLVGHDWGGVISYRIAAETRGLFDHVVTINAPYMAYTAHVLGARLSRASDLMAKWRFAQATQQLSPVFSQIRKSGYTYMLTLPFALAKHMPRLSTCLVKYVHRMEHGHRGEPTIDEATSRLAMAYGPSSFEEGIASSNGCSYGPSVFARSNTFPPGDWDQKVLLYSSGLLRDKWSPSYSGCEVVSADTETNLHDGVKHFQYPVDIIFGLQDVALDPRVVVDGIEKCFLPGTGDAASRIVRIPDCGHWSILQDKGSEAVESILLQILNAR